MKTKISPQENEKIEKILQKFPDLFLFFKQEIIKIPSEYVDILDNGFDKELFREFMNKYILQKVSKINKDIETVVKTMDFSDEGKVKKIAEVGSIALNILIKDYLEKLEQESNIREEDLDSLIEIIDCRNKIQVEEKVYLENLYKKYLLQQVK